MRRLTRTPRLVSIGPFHHGRPNLKAMEEQKLRYLHAFLGRGSSMSSRLKEYVRVMKAWEEKARGCYAESIELSSDEFVKMLLLDATFIIEVICRYKLLVGGDTTPHNSMELGMVLDVRGDMILLENQIPFFVIQDLFNLHLNYSNNNNSTFTPNFNSFLTLSIAYFRSISSARDFESSTPTSNQEIKHFVDLLRLWHLPRSQMSLPQLKVGKSIRMYNATELQDAGVKLKKGSGNGLLDIRYSNKTLEIPQLAISDPTESLFRNIIALEQCHYLNDNYICDYVRFMDDLIDTGKDVEVLVQNQIIVNQLGDSTAVATLFNKLAIHVFIWGQNYYYYATTRDVNAYSEAPWNRWKATLRRDYFSTPWIIASTVAAAILLLLTVIQTVCSIVSLF